MHAIGDLASVAARESLLDRGLQALKRLPIAACGSLSVFLGFAQLQCMSRCIARASSDDAADRNVVIDFLETLREGDWISRLNAK